MQSHLVRSAQPQMSAELDFANIINYKIRDTQFAFYCNAETTRVRRRRTRALILDTAHSIESLNRLPLGCLIGTRGQPSGHPSHV
jgi:hypothetical protein